MNKTFVIIAFLITALSAVAAAWVIADKYLSLKRTQVENEARYQCAVSSRYETKINENTTVWYSVEELYNKCLKEKGL